MPSDEEILMERLREWLDHRPEGVHLPTPPPGTDASGYKLTPVPTKVVEPEPGKVESWRDRPALL